MHCRSLPRAVYRIPLKLSHPSSVETISQNQQISAAKPAWPWWPSSQDGSLEADPVDEVVDVIPSAVLVASVTLEPGYDQSSIAVAGVPAWSPRSPRPAGPPESTVMAVPHVSPELAEALLVGAAAVTPAVTLPKAKDPQRGDVVLPS